MNRLFLVSESNSLHGEISSETWEIDGVLSVK